MHLRCVTRKFPTKYFTALQPVKPWRTMDDIAEQLIAKRNRGKAAKRSSYLGASSSSSNTDSSSDDESHQRRSIRLKRLGERNMRSGAVDAMDSDG